MGQANNSAWGVFETAVGIQIQRVSGWKQHLGLKARNTRKESGIQERVEALSDLQRDGS